MTIDHFRNHGWTPGQSCDYGGVIYTIASVDFAEDLVGLQTPLSPDGIIWVRCENVILQDEAITAIELIAAERKRQITAEGYSAAHDDDCTLGQLAGAAAIYALHACGFSEAEWIEAKRPPVTGKVRIWPWADSCWKPSGDSIRDMVKACALMAAELDRRLRLDFQNGNVEVLPITTGSQPSDTPGTAAFAQRLSDAKVPASKVWTHWYDHAAKLERELAAKALAHDVTRHMLKLKSAECIRANKTIAAMSCAENQTSPSVSASECLPSQTVCLLREDERILKLESDLKEARRLAEKYRNLSCDSQEQCDARLLPWENAPA